MFDKIEELYKRKSLYNKIKIKILWLSFFMTFLLWILSLNDLYIMMILTLIGIFFVFKKICEKTVDIKLHKNFSRKSEDDQSLKEIINVIDKNTMKNFIKENGIYTKENLNNIIEHYRTYIKSKIVGDNFWTIISIIVSVSLAFVTKKGFDVNGFKKSLPYLISITFMMGMVYYSIKHITKFKRILTGEDGIYERLEIIFSELYIEYEKDVKINKKQKKKQFK